MVEIYVVKSGDTLSEIASRLVSPFVASRIEQYSRGANLSGQTLRLHRQNAKKPEPEAHVVAKGETLYKISRRYGLSVSEIKELNGLEDDSLLSGMTLRLGKVKVEEETAPESFEYVVQRGENLSDIARRLNIGLNLLRQLNQLEGDHISSGAETRRAPPPWMKPFTSCVPEKLFPPSPLNTVSTYPSSKK